MASKIENETEFEADINALWNAITADVGALRQAAPQILTDAHVTEVDGYPVASINISDVAPHIPPFKEKIVEFDPNNHAFSVEGIDGGFLKLGFAYYKVSYKLDDLGDGKVSAKTTITYDLENDVDGTQLLEEFSKIACDFIKIMASYLQKPSA